MKKTIMAAAAAALLLGAGTSHAGAASSGTHRYPVAPNPIADAPNIRVIDSTPETELIESLKKGEWPDEFVIVAMMQTLSGQRLKPDSYPIFLSSKWRLNLLHQMIDGGQKRGIYNNAEMLEDIMVRWEAGDYSKIERDDWVLKKMLDLHHESFNDGA
ncbi:hypothetical protein [Saccharibacillus alkalitolerans]|uniref:Uncharacterized protein n=1 Tax=Saccharibacillus alkalitolerans TaxID=2705290 RepID=A0ABX0F7N0_9BACL|nr:hypothetical protein [Saccharibacillus alkalitolerans]NGZ74022.1 hypothetical protein [Saccharibacillus alkalitolerans]